MTRLSGENSRLRDELAQCEKDKEFVWSLWKRLQSASPDVSAAVADVQRHEQQKQEDRDNKVLAVLGSKDNVIRDLETQLARMTSELDAKCAECEQLTRFKHQLEVDNSAITDRVREIELLVSDREHSANLKQQNTNQALQEMQQQTVGFKARCDALINEVDTLRSSNSELSSRNGFLSRKVGELEDEVRKRSFELDRVSVEHRQNLEERMNLDLRLKSQCNESMVASQELSRFTDENRSLKDNLMTLQKSFDKLAIDNRRQTELIRQLQNLQKDTEGVMKNQEDVYNAEKKNYQAMYYETSAKLKESMSEEQKVRFEYEQMKTDLGTENSALKSQLRSLEAQVKELKPKRVVVGDELVDVSPECAVKLTAYENEVQLLQSKLNERNRTIQALELKESTNRTRSADHGAKKRSSSARTQGARARSLSPLATNRNALELARKLSVSDKKVANLTVKLKSTESELQEVKKAHERRLSRFKSLQQEMVLLREQLKTYEKNPDYGTRSLNEVLKSPKEKLVKQIERMKNQNITLMDQKIDLQETIDRLRVERARDSALMKDLQQNLTEEFENKNDDEGEIKRWMSECKKLESKVLDLKEELIISDQAKDALAKECNRLTEVSEELKISLKAKTLVEKLEKQPAPAKRAVVKKTSKAKLNRSGTAKIRPSSAKIKQRHNLSLLRNINENASLMQNDDGNNDSDQYEDIAESDFEESDTLRTVNSSFSLGQRIREVAKANKKIEKASKKPTSNKNTSTQTDIDLSNANTLAHLVGMMSNNTTPRDATTDDTATFDSSSYTTGATLTSKVKSKNRYDMASKFRTGLDQQGVKKQKAAPTSNSSVTSYKSKQIIKSLKSENAALGEKCEYLTEQNTVLRSAKTSLQFTIDGLYAQVDKLTNEQQNLSTKLRCAKAKEQKLAGEVDKLEKAKAEIEAKSEEARRSKSDTEVKSLESRLRSAQGETNRLKQELKCVLEEKDHKDVEHKNLTEKIQRLERDIAQKRSLIENLRFKVKSFEDTVKVDLKQQSEVDAKTQALRETAEAAKRTVENLRTQLAHYKGINVDAIQKVEKLEKQLKSMESKKHEYENFASEIENVATSQLEGLAMQSEVAIERLQSQLKDAGVIVKEFITLFRSFANELVSKMSKQSRELSTKKLENHRSKYTQGMLAARSKAAEILDLSTEDIDEIMTPNDSGIEIYSKTEVYRSRVEEVLNSKAPFANEMMSLLLEVLNEYSRVTSEAAILKYEAY